MAQTLVPVSLPIHLQCLCAPMLWQVNIGVIDGSAFGPEPFFCPLGKDEQRQPYSYDPWEKRGELFRLKEDDNEAAAGLLNSVGLFETPELSLQILGQLERSLDAKERVSKRELVDRMYRFVRQIGWVQGIDGWHGVRWGAAVAFPARLFWKFRRSILEEMKPQASDAFTQRDYAARFAGLLRLGPSTIITALTFKDAVAASIRIDQLQKAKFKRCQRPDCAIPFAAVGPRKRKFCTWYCGHITSVRKKRGRTK